MLREGGLVLRAVGQHDDRAVAQVGMHAVPQPVGRGGLLKAVGQSLRHFDEHWHGGARQKMLVSSDHLGRDRASSRTETRRRRTCRCR